LDAAPPEDVDGADTEVDRVEPPIGVDATGRALPCRRCTATATATITTSDSTAASTVAARGLNPRACELCLPIAPPGRWQYVRQRPEATSPVLVSKPLIRGLTDQDRPN